MIENDFHKFFNVDKETFNNKFITLENIEKDLFEEGTECVFLFNSIYDHVCASQNKINGQEVKNSSADIAEANKMLQDKFQKTFPSITIMNDILSKSYTDVFSDWMCPGTTYVRCKEDLVKHLQQHGCEKFCVKKAYTNSGDGVSIVARDDLKKINQFGGCDSFILQKDLTETYKNNPEYRFVVFGGEIIYVNFTFDYFCKEMVKDFCSDEHPIKGSEEKKNHHEFHSNTQHLRLNKHVQHFLEEILQELKQKYKTEKEEKSIWRIDVLIQGDIFGIVKPPICYLNEIECFCSALLTDFPIFFSKNDKEEYVTCDKLNKSRSQNKHHALHYLSEPKCNGVKKKVYKTKTEKNSDAKARQTKQN